MTLRLLIVVFGFCGLSLRAESISVFGEAPPVVFLANYMDSFNPNNAHAAEQSLNVDYFPFNRRETNTLETLRNEVESMQAYGLDGAQIWPGYKQAAEWMDALTELNLEKPFYISPQIAGVAAVFYPTYADFVKATVEFLKNYGKHPHMLTFDGKPVISTWGTVAGYIDDMEKLRADVKAAGVGEFFILPTIDLGVHKPNMKKLAEIRDQHYDGYNAWRQMRDTDNIRTVTAFLSEKRYNVFPVGSIWSGYCNNNRMFLDNYRIYYGAQELIRSFDAGLDTGLRWMILVTWNDVHESASFPSWKNVYGTQEITRFYRAVYETGKTDRSEMGVVLSYLPDMLLGDRWDFGVTLLPGTNTVAGKRWSGTLSLENVQGKEILRRELSTLFSRTDRAHFFPNLIELPDLSDPVFTPVLTLNGITRRLAPVTIRHGRSRTTPPVMISFDHLTEASVDFSLNSSIVFQKNPLKVSVSVKSDVALDEVNLASGSDILLDMSATSGNDYPFYLAVDNWTEAPKDIKISLSQGVFVNRHVRDGWGAPGEESPLSGTNFLLNLPSTTAGFRPESPVIIIAGKTASPSNTMVTFSSGEQAKTRSLFELARNSMTVKTGENKWIRLRTLENGQGRTAAVHLGERQVTFNAFLPNLARNEKFRVIHVQGRCADGRVFFSKPFVWFRKELDEDNVSVPIVCSQVGFDDDIADPTTRSRFAFESTQVQSVYLHPARIPSYSFDFDEGGGWLVNDSGDYAMRGWGWRCSAGSRKVKWGAPSAEDPQWESQDAVIGSAMRFSKTSRLGLRSNSGFSGSFTLEGWIKPDDLGSGGLIYADTDELRFEIKPGGTLSAMRDVSAVAGSGCALQTDRKLRSGQWQQIALVYDLKSLRIYINGQLAAETDAPATLFRIHSTPWFGATSRKLADGFSGILDEVTLSARPLSAAELASRYADTSSHLQ